MRSTLKKSVESDVTSGCKAQTSEAGGLEEGGLHGCHPHLAKGLQAPQGPKPQVFESSKAPMTSKDFRMPKFNDMRPEFPQSLNIVGPTIHIIYHLYIFPCQSASKASLATALRQASMKVSKRTKGSINHPSPEASPSCWKKHVVCGFCRNSVNLFLGDLNVMNLGNPPKCHATYVLVHFFGGPKDAKSDGEGFWRTRECSSESKTLGSFKAAYKVRPLIGHHRILMEFPTRSMVKHIVICWSDRIAIYWTNI